jgi:rubrerythrin
VPTFYKKAPIFSKLDELAPVKAQNDTDARVERALAARRRNGSSQQGELTDDDVESMIASRRKGRKSKSAGFCPKCGKPVMASDKFCPSCGKTLS